MNQHIRMDMEWIDMVMIFKAIIYHLDEIMIMSILESDRTDISRSKIYYQDDKFFIQRESTIEVNPKGLYLPGIREYTSAFPMRTFNKFSNANLAQTWINNLIDACNNLGIEPPIVIRLSDFVMTAYEPIPERKLP
jgi:hypothetical protein